MKEHCRAVMAIVRKDVYGLLPLVLLASVVFLVQPVIAGMDVLALSGDSTFWEMARTNVYWLGYFLGALLMISVLQQDPAASLDHDWLTRPVHRADWMAAKLLFMLLAIVVPVILGRVLADLLQGHGPMASLSYALAIEKLPAVLPVPLLFGVALLAPTLRRTVFLLVMVLLVFLLPGWSVTRPLLSMAGIELGGDFGGLMWLQALPIMVGGLGGVLLIYWWLYCRREQTRAYLAFWGVVTVVFLSVYPPGWLYGWDTAIAVHRAMINRTDDPAGDTIRLEPVQACFPAARADGGISGGQQDALMTRAAWGGEALRAAGPGAITFATPVRTAGAPVEWISPSTLQREISVDWRVDRLRARARYSADSLEEDVELIRSFTAENRFAPVAGTDTDYWLIPGDRVSALADDPSTRLTLEYDLALLSPSVHELPTDGQLRTFPELGRCKAGIDRNTHVIRVDCRQRGRRPELVSAELIGVESSRVDSAIGASFTADWLEALGRRHYELTLDSPDLVDTGSVLVTAYNTERILRRQVVTRGLLGDTTALCPLPGDERRATMERSSWSDTSPHEVRSVAVEPGVRLEVLDWRSGEHATAPTLFLLPGLGATAHSYDELAARLAVDYNVVGMTRRGTGASDKPDHGYDIERLGRDVLQVLDTLEIESPILVGHSIGGEEISHLGANHPGRFSGLVYLDAAFDRVTVDTDDRRLRTLNARLPSPPPLRPSEAVSYEALLGYAERTRGERLLPPEGEIMASYDLDSGMIRHDPLYLDAILMGLRSPQYEQITVPSLALFAVPGSPEALMEGWYDAEDPVLRETVAELFRIERRRRDAAMERFDTRAPQSEVVAIENADHWIFVSHEEEVLEAIRRFVTSLEQGGLPDGQ